MKDLEMKKDILKEIMGMMSKMGYEKLKKPVVMEIEVESGEDCDEASVINPPDAEAPYGEDDEAAKGADEAEAIKNRLMKRFGKA